MRTILLIGALACQAAAQTLTEPPALIQLSRIPGNGWTSVRRFADAKAAVDVIGMTAITGPAESWLVATHDSFASIESVDKSIHRANSPDTSGDLPDANNGDLLSTSRSLIAVYRPAWSYRPDQAIRTLQKARYCQVSMYRIRPGTEAEFAELVKSQRVLFDSINLDRPDIAYHVISGAPAGTYIFMAPLVSLKVLDEGLAKAPAYAEGVAAKAPKETDFTRVHLLFRIEPEMSWVSDEFASADAEFWRSKTP